MLDTADIKLPGVHNIENYMAAVAAVDGMVPDEAIRAFARTFGGVEHRIELVRELDGVRWYNDSIASSPSRTIAGLRSFPEKVILIAGGKDKGISYDAIGPEINEHVKALILCGATAGVIRAAVEKAANFTGLPITEVDSYQSAVALARETARPGDVVLLSPASTSFDRFANFMERGRVFKDLVNALKYVPGRPRIRWREGGVMAMIWRRILLLPPADGPPAGAAGPGVSADGSGADGALHRRHPDAASAGGMATTRVSNTVTRIVSEAVYEAIERGRAAVRRAWCPLRRTRRATSPLCRATWRPSTTCRRRFSDTVLTRISQVPTGDLSIPIGSLTGSTLLAGRGPRITVRMESVGSSEANFRNAFTSAGINQTQH